MKYRIFKHTFELKDLGTGNRLRIPLNNHRLVRWLDAKPNPASAHKFDVWSLVEETPSPISEFGLIEVVGTGWLLEPICAMEYIATVRTPADYVRHLFGLTPGLKFEEAGL